MPEFTAGAPRRAIGFWIESPSGAQWNNQGMTRLIGFIIEGAAIGRRYIFRVCVTDEIRDEAEADLLTLNAQIGVDYTIHSPRDENGRAESFAELAEFANRSVAVDAWISIFPNQLAACRLIKPVSIIFPDAIGLDYHDFNALAWSRQGHTVIWRNNVRQQLPHIHNIITFSKHVAEQQVIKHFDVAPDRIRVIPHAPPTLDGILPFVKDGQRDDKSRFYAAEMLRWHARRRGLAYLADFPFEHVRYVAVSTQDRVTKNLRIVADAIQRITRDEGGDIKAIVTAQINFEANHTPLPRVISAAQMQLDVVSMPDLPREIHAAFLHCAEIAVHPAVFEGGRGVFPYYEAISVGTPCLMAAGPHVSEFVTDAPDMLPYVFDPSDATALARMINFVSSERESVTAKQAKIFARLRERQWDMVADEYARAALEISQKMV